MDPFVRKMVFGALGFGTTMLLMGGTLSAIYFHNRLPCSESVVSETASADGQWNAAVMERRCGEEQPFHMHVNVIPAGHAIEVAYFSGLSKDGEVFEAEEETQDSAPAVEWNSPRQITIHCPWCRSTLVRKQKAQQGPIAIHYQLQR